MKNKVIDCKILKVDDFIYAYSNEPLVKNCLAINTKNLGLMYFSEAYFFELEKMKINKYWFKVEMTNGKVKVGTPIFLFDKFFIELYIENKGLINEIKIENGEVVEYSLKEEQKDPYVIVFNTLGLKRIFKILFWSKKRRLQFVNEVKNGNSIINSYQIASKWKNK